jgi:hypothetical protein
MRHSRWWVVLGALRCAARASGTVQRCWGLTVCNLMGSGGLVLGVCFVAVRDGGVGAWARRCAEGWDQLQLGVRVLSVCPT